MKSYWPGRKNKVTWFVLFGQLREEILGDFYVPNTWRQKLRIHVLRRMGPMSHAAHTLLQLSKRYQAVRAKRT